jgi:hypothetical protein
MLAPLRSHQRSLHRALAPQSLTITSKFRRAVLIPHHHHSGRSHDPSVRTLEELFPGEFHGRALPTTRILRVIHDLGLAAVERRQREILLRRVYCAEALEHAGRKNCLEQIVDGAAQRRETGDDDADGVLGRAERGRGDGDVEVVFDAVEVPVQSCVVEGFGNGDSGAAGAVGLVVGGDAVA